MDVKYANHKIRDYCKVNDHINIYAYCGHTTVAKSIKETDFTSGDNFFCVECIRGRISVLKDHIRDLKKRKTAMKERVKQVELEDPKTGTYWQLENTLGEDLYYISMEKPSKEVVSFDATTLYDLKEKMLAHVSLKDAERIYSNLVSLFNTTEYESSFKLWQKENSSSLRSRSSALKN